MESGARLLLLSSSVVRVDVEVAEYGGDLLSHLSPPIVYLVNCAADSVHRVLQVSHCAVRLLGSLLNVVQVALHNGELLV